MDSLEPYPDFSRYQSCIKFYGKSILPPLLTDTKRDEIQRSRKQAALCEERLNERKAAHVPKEFHKSLSEGNLQTLSYLYQEDLHVSNTNNSLCMAESCGSLQSLNDICEEDEDEEIISISIEESFDSTAPKTENMQETFNGICPLDAMTDHQISPSDISNSFNQSNSWISESMKGSSADSGTSRESSDSDDADFKSMNTVVSNVYVDVNCNQDSDSVITSVARSSDLDKYMDFYDEGQFSVQSPIAMDARDVGALITFSSSTSAETLIDHSNSSTPFVPSMVPLLDSNLTTSQNDQNKPFLTAPMCHQQNRTNIFTNLLSNGEMNKIDSTDQVVISSLNGDVSQMFTTDSESNTESVRPGHRRSNSYTIELPSPVLLESHADCPCLVSPVGVPVPHCSSIGVCPSYFFANSKAKENDQNHVEKEQAHLNSSDIFENAVQQPTETTNKEVHALANSICDSTSKEEVLNELYKTFKEMHQQKVEKLLKEQHEQWMKLQSEFEEQEQEILNRLQEINLKNPEEKSTLETESNLIIPQDVNEDIYPNVNDQQSIPVVQPQMPLQSLLSAVKHKAALQIPEVDLSKDPSEEAKSLTSLIVQQKFEEEHSEAVNDPANQEKFIKLTAAAKGFLVRCLLRTALVQNIKRTILDSLDMICTIQERALKRGLNEEDVHLHTACRKQMWNALDDIHHIFFLLSTEEKMRIISECRKRGGEIRKKPVPVPQAPPRKSLPTSICSEPATTKPSPKLSSATLKRLERLKSQDTISRSSRKSCRIAMTSPKGRSPSIKNITFSTRSKSSLASFPLTKRN